MTTTLRLRPRYVSKSDSKLMQLVSKIPGVPSQFMTHFWTTIGHTVYVPSALDFEPDWGTYTWYARHARTIEHEYIHVAQYERWTFPLFALLYIGPFVPLMLLLPASIAYAVATLSWLGLLVHILAAALSLPLTFGLAWGRWRLEREAYMVQLRSDPSEEMAVWIADTLWNDYGFAWPKSWARKWFMEQLKKEGR